MFCFRFLFLFYFIHFQLFILFSPHFESVILFIFRYLQRYIYFRIVRMSKIATFGRIFCSFAAVFFVCLKKKLHFFLSHFQRFKSLSKNILKKIFGDFKNCCIFAANKNDKDMTHTQHNTEHMTAAQRAAWHDCQLGIFDKWFRYNHKDGGTAYNNAWMEANKVYQNDNVQFIECN